VVDYRPGAGIRIAPHFYNTDDECLAVIEEIETITRSL
jgi:kynureninase